MVLDKSNREDFSSGCRKKVHENKSVKFSLSRWYTKSLLTYEYHEFELQINK